MRKITVTAIAFCAMATTGAMAADTTTASVSDCNTMATQVQTALDANQSSSNFDAATKEKHNGRDFCYNGMPQVGVAHYAHALKLLGASAS